MNKILATITTAIILITVLSLSANLQPNAKADPTNPLLTVNGLVETPLNINLTELQAMPKTTLYAAIICVDFPSTVVEQGNWTGIKIRTLLETAKIKQGAVKIVFAAADGYSSGLTVEDAMRNDVILAYEKDGITLSGLRLVVPGKWGYKWVNQVAHIEVVDYDYLGFWESKGYTDSAEISEGQQKPGPITLPKPLPSQTGPPTSTPTSPSSSSPTPTPNQSPNPAPGALQEPTQTPSANQAYWVPLEAVYAAAAAGVVALGIVALIVKKKKIER